MTQNSHSFTPNPDDYRWPAEWESHVCTWAAWPVNEKTWPGLFDQIPPTFARFIAAVARFEPVRLLAGPPAEADAIHRLTDPACEQAGSRHPIELIDIPVNDSWCRDHGPIFLVGRPDTAAGGQSLIIDWDYNAWGEKYGPWDKDQRVAGSVARLLDIPSLRPGLVLEGGAIEGDGQGTVLTTDSCLTCHNRNPGATRQSMEQALQRYLGARRVIWLPGGGIIGDDTDGHIDQTARFVNPDTVVLATPHDPDAPEAEALRANREALEADAASAGQPLTLIDLPLPAPKFQQDSRLPASYCNYCLVNGGVIVPTFRDDADETALQILAECFPDREILGIDALDLVWGLGAFHCMTQQQPEAGLISV